LPKHRHGRLHSLLILFEDLWFSMTGIFGIFLLGLLAFCTVQACMDSVSVPERWISAAVAALTIVVIFWRFRAFRRGITRLSGGERTQWELDRIGYRYGSTRIYGLALGVVFLSLSCTLVFISGSPWWFKALCILTAPTSLIFLIRTLRQKHLRRPCPGCGGRLQIKRTIMRFTGTVITCAECGLETTCAQEEEDSGY
jgi:hypothetical protein